MNMILKKSLFSFLVFFASGGDALKISPMVDGEADTPISSLKDAKIEKDDLFQDAFGLGDGMVSIYNI